MEFADPEDVYEVLVAKGVISVPMLRRLTQADVDAWDVELQIKLELRGMIASESNPRHDCFAELFRGTAIGIPWDENW